MAEGGRFRSVDLDCDLTLAVTSSLDYCKSIDHKGDRGALCELLVAEIRIVADRYMHCYLTFLAVSFAANPSFVL